MKLVTLAFFMLAAPAFADIPSLPSDFSTVVISGPDAFELEESLVAPTLRGDQLRTFTSAHKVWRARSGLSQIVCTLTSGGLLGDGGNKKTATCTIQKSKTGNPLPVFRPLRRLG